MNEFDQLRTDAVAEIIQWRKDNMAIEFVDVPVAIFMSWCLTLDQEVMHGLSIGEVNIAFRAWLLNPGTEVVL